MGPGQGLSAERDPELWAKMNLPAVGRGAGLPAGAGLADRSHRAT